MRSVLVWLIISFSFLFSPKAYARCWWVVEPEAAEQGVEVRLNMWENCAMRWKRKHYHTFSNQLHVCGIHQGEVYYVGTVRRDRQVFGWGHEISELYDNIWFGPILVEGKLFYVATNKGNDRPHNTMVYGDQVYHLGFMASIPASGPVIYEGEPVTIVRGDNDYWTVYVGNTPDRKSFPHVPRWGPDEQSIWNVRIHEGSLIYSAHDPSSEYRDYIWGVPLCK